MAVGRINEPLLAKDIIKAGKADLVCIGRGLPADQAMPKKALEGRVERFGVTYHLSQKVTPDTLKNHSPDVVILDTGSAPVYPQINGINNALVIPIDAALNGHGQAGGKTVVVGGRCWVALFNL